MSLFFLCFIWSSKSFLLISCVLHNDFLRLFIYLTLTLHSQEALFFKCTVHMATLYTLFMIREMQGEVNKNGDERGGGGRRGVIACGPLGYS